MSKKIITSAVFTFLVTAGFCRACAGNKQLDTQQPEKDANCIETILEQLNRKTKELQSYEAQIEYKFSQPLFESETLRKGVLYYAKYGKRSFLRLNFQTLKQDNEEQQKHIEHFIFDGVWLTHIDYQMKAVKRYQMAEPNQPANAFDLVSKNLPIVGFNKIEDLKKQFEIKLIEQKPSVIPAQPGTQEFIKLNLKVKRDSVYKDDYTSIDFWIDKKLYLPAKVAAVSTEEDIYEIKFVKPNVNKKLDKKVFDFEIAEGFSVVTEPLKKKEPK